jgi:hypothetical protein
MRALSRKGGLVAVVAASLAIGGAAGAQDRLLVDTVVYRFSSPELGGPAKPRFITARFLAFEASLEAGAEQVTDGYHPRHVRAAVDRHVAEEMLASLPLNPSPSRDEVERLAADIATDMPDAAAAREGVGKDEVRALTFRQARAAIYIDRALSPILHPTDEQLREVFRTSAHPFRGRRYDEARAALERWFVGERLRVAEATFYQSARSRVKLTLLASSPSSP